MNHLLPYREPYRVSAAVLAIAVHVAFILFLYSGFRLHSKPVDDFGVERWQDLPVMEVDETATLPPRVPTEEPPIPSAKSAAALSDAEIQLREKKKKLAEREEKQKNDAKLVAAARKARQEAERKELEKYAESLRVRKNERERIRAEVNATSAAEIGRYQDMIRSKIRHNIVMPPDVPPSAQAVFRVTLLPGGMVMEVVMLKSSGHRAYDDAAERAIHKSEPLPLPPDAELQKQFRELRLSIRPEEE